MLDRSYVTSAENYINLQSAYYIGFLKKSIGV